MEFIVLSTEKGELFEVVYERWTHPPLGADCIHIGVKRLSSQNEKIIRELFPNIDRNSYRAINVTDEHNKLELTSSPENDVHITRFCFRVPMLSAEGARERAFERLALTLGEADYSAQLTAKWNGFDDYVMEL